LDSRLIAAEEQHFDATVSSQLDTANKRYRTLLHAFLIYSKYLIVNIRARSFTSVLYVIRGVDIGEKPRARSFTNLMAEVFDILNASFYDTIKAMKDKEDGGTEVVNELPLPRLFISKNRTMLEFAASDPKAVLTVLINASVKKCTEPEKKGLYHVQADAVLVHPLGNRHDLDQLHWPEKIAQAEYAPRAWIKVKILKIVRGFEADITEKMEREIFKRLYTTTRLAYDPKESALHNQIAKVFVKSVIGASMDPEDVIDFAAAAKSKSNNASRSSQPPLPAPNKIPSVEQAAVHSVNALDHGMPGTTGATPMEEDKPDTGRIATVAPTHEKPDTQIAQEAISHSTDNRISQEAKTQNQVEDEEDQYMYQDEEQEEDQDEDQDLDYDYDEDGSYSKGGDDELSQEVISVSRSRTPTPSRPEEAITFMRIIDNENEAATKDEKQEEDEKMRAIYRQRSQAIWEKLVFSELLLST
jgi:hypothetical protein